MEDACIEQTTNLSLPSAHNDPHGTAEPSTGPTAALEVGLNYPAGRGQGETRSGLGLGSLAGHGKCVAGVPLDGTETTVGHNTVILDSSGVADVEVRYYGEGDEGYIPSPTIVENQYGVDMNVDGHGCGRVRAPPKPRQAASFAAHGHGSGVVVGCLQPQLRLRSSRFSWMAKMPLWLEHRRHNDHLRTMPIRIFVDCHADSMEWTPEHLTQVCELFAEQVEKGNRQNTHLNGVGGTQLKNKWDKLKPEFVTWQKLMKRQTSTSWYHLRKTIDMDPEWWRKMKAQNPVCAKFKKCPIQNEELLIKMFKDITNDESDHRNPMTENPIIPKSQLSNMTGVSILPDGDVAEDVSPSLASLSEDNSETDSEEDTEFIRMVSSGGQITTYIGMYIDKNPSQTSTLSGMGWLKETLHTLSECHSQLRMSTEIFMDFHDLLVRKYGLQASLRMSKYESLAICLFICGGNESNRRSQNCFKHSGEMISRKFDEVLNATMAMAKDFIRPKNPYFPKAYPHFRDCIGALDGTNIHVCLSPDEQIRFIGKSGIPTQNVLVVCDFDMRFTYVPTGQLGAMHETSVLCSTIQVDENFSTPSTRGLEPKTPREKLNRVHSSIRNVIERCFGVLIKMKWQILYNMPPYSMTKQKKIVVATMFRFLS
ncbi:hypothetical protein U9M48_036667 [Paspalum notatum var. saurae]|uniref:DDE Tnp4 domain-containing protein n=1 Tax=Paspalum notatum var. saurae TaxID=547442 RepID=A0AAQ3X977_PASNO